MPRRLTTRTEPPYTLSTLPVGSYPNYSLGLAGPDDRIPWTIRRKDRYFNVLLTGGQGSGKSSMLVRLALNDIYDPDTAAIIIDMKGTLSNRLLQLCPPNLIANALDPTTGETRSQTKRVWYLDLDRPAFGMTPLRVEAGWNKNELASEFARIADSMTRVLLDLFPDQLMASSKDIIDRATIGAMALAWFEHDRDCRADGIDPTTKSFVGSVEVLSNMLVPVDRSKPETDANGRKTIHPNPWHVAAGKVCQTLPNLDTVGRDLLVDMPARARENLSNLTQRMEAPGNKIRPLVGAAVNARRFVEHPYAMSLSDLIRRRDVLIVNPRLDKLGEDQATIICNFIVHLIDAEMKRQAERTQEKRTRVSLCADEAHRLISPTLMQMVATHREAGFDCAFAVQYVAQIGNGFDTATRQQMLAGVGNLMQHKITFRSSNEEDATALAAISSPVHQTLVRADPVSRSRVPVDPAVIRNLENYTAVVSTVSGAAGSGGSGEPDFGMQISRLKAFTSQTHPMMEVNEVGNEWADEHLRRQREEFKEYPENMSAHAKTAPPDVTAAPVPSPHVAADHQAKDAASASAQMAKKQPKPTAPKTTKRSPGPSVETSQSVAAPSQPGKARDLGDIWAQQLAGESPPPDVDDSMQAMWETGPPPHSPYGDTGARANTTEAEMPPVEEERIDVNVRLTDPNANEVDRSSINLKHALKPTKQPLPTGDVPVLSGTSYMAAVEEATRIDEATGREPWTLDIVEKLQAAISAAKTDLSTEIGKARGAVASATNLGSGDMASVESDVNELSKRLLAIVKSVDQTVKRPRAAFDDTGLDEMLQQSDADTRNLLAKAKREQLSGPASGDAWKQLQRARSDVAALVSGLSFCLDAKGAAAKGQVREASLACDKAVAALQPMFLIGVSSSFSEKLEQLSQALRQSRSRGSDIAMDAALLRTLMVANRFDYVSPRLLALLIEENQPTPERTMRERVRKLRELSLVATTRVISDRRGQKTPLYSVTSSGRQALRNAINQGAALKSQSTGKVHSYLAAERDLASDKLQGDTMRHDTAVQLTLAAFRESLDAEVSWTTAIMPGARLDPKSIARRPLQRNDLIAQSGLKLQGENLDVVSRIEPDLTLRIDRIGSADNNATELLIEVDRTSSAEYNRSKLLAYDHFLAGWFHIARRWSQPMSRRPAVVFVMPNSRSAISLLALMDEQLTVGVAASAAYEPEKFWYPGRDHIAVTTIDWILGGKLFGMRVPPLPLAARSMTPMQSRNVELVDASWWRGR